MDLVDSLSAIWDQPACAGEVFHPFPEIPWCFPDESEDYSLSTFLNLEPDDSLWLQQPSPDRDEDITDYLLVSSTPFTGTEPDLGATTIADMSIPHSLSDHSNSTSQLCQEPAQARGQCKEKAQKLEPKVWDQMFPVISNLFASNKIDTIRHILSKRHNFNPRLVSSVPMMVSIDELRSLKYQTTENQDHLLAEGRPVAC